MDAMGTALAADAPRLAVVHRLAAVGPWAALAVVEPQAAISQTGEAADAIGVGSDVWTMLPI